MDFNQKGVIMNYQPYCDHKNVEGILYSAAGFLVTHERHPFMERENNLLSTIIVTAMVIKTITTMIMVLIVRVITATRQQILLH